MQKSTHLFHLFSNLLKDPCPYLLALFERPKSELVYYQQECEAVTMPDFVPFKGLRYTPGVVALDQVIAPPYDIISSSERVRLAARNPNNAVFVELPEPDLQGGLDRYRVAKNLLDKWTSTGILKSDPRPALYPYKMTGLDGSSCTGIVGALRLEDPNDNSGILPHEQTLPKPKSDRLDLLRSTRMNLSPIWGLSLTSGLTKTFDPCDSEPVQDVYDDEGVRHVMWILEDEEKIATIRESVSTSPIVIADGHHRYDTALSFQKESQQLLGKDSISQDGTQVHGYDFVMAFIVELADEQLQVGAIHRTIPVLADDLDLATALEPWFDILRVGDTNERTISAVIASDTLALVVSHSTFLLTPRTESYEEAGSDLDSSLVAMALDKIGNIESQHCHSRREAAESVVNGQAAAALMLRPVTVEQISNWARQARRMPPKTTYFSPKPRTGMVFRSLDLY